MPDTFRLVLTVDVVKYKPYILVSTNLREMSILEQLTPDVAVPHKGVLPYMCHGKDDDSYYIVTRLHEG